MGSIMGKRILIVEDNGLIGDIIAETIVDAGGLPLGPVLSEREALEMIDYDPGVSDAAILDIRLDGMSFTLATRLQDLGVPFIFASGKCQEVPVHLRDIMMCQKPYTPGELLTALEQAMAIAQH